MNGRCAFGPMSGPMASISIFAPMAAAFFICSTVMLTTANSAWVTTLGGQRHVVLQDDRLHLARQVELRRLVVVHRAAEDVRRAVRVEVDQPLDRADGGRRGREDADLRLGRARAGAAGGQGGRARHGDL